MMNHLKSKASQLFRNAPSADEKAANAFPEQEADFDARIERRLRKKGSRFLRRHDDKPLPAPPRPISKDDADGHGDGMFNVAQKPKSTATEKPLPSRPGSAEISGSEVQSISGEDVSSGAVREAKPVEVVVKKRPSFASLRKSSSRIFRSTTSDYGPPPPPVPQIPIDTPAPKPRRPVLRPLNSVRSGRSSRASSDRTICISRPISSTQLQHLPTDLSVPKQSFVKPSSPPPPRPPRPGSTDHELVALSLDSSSRMVLRNPTRARPPLETTTAPPARSPALTPIWSEATSARLGLPSAHSSLSSPQSPVFDSPLASPSDSPRTSPLDSPLAAIFPLDPTQPLPFRDSAGSVKGYSRFSAYVKARQQYEKGGYGDGVERDDRDLGPIEMYCASKCADWKLERRVSGGLGYRGMLFRDRWGGWHFVADV